MTNSAFKLSSIFALTPAMSEGAEVERVEDRPNISSTIFTLSSPEVHVRTNKAIRKKKKLQLVYLAVRKREYNTIVNHKYYAGG